MSDLLPTILTKDAVIEMLAACVRDFDSAEVALEIKDKHKDAIAFATASQIKLATKDE